MRNGNDFLSHIKIDKAIEEMGDRRLLEFVAQEISSLVPSVKANTKRSKTNQIALIVLIATLIALGVIDNGILRIFGI